MAKDFIRRPAGSGEPQAIGEILKYYFENSDEPLAVAYRNWKAQNKPATNAAEEPPRYTREHTFQDCCREAADEPYTMAGLVEKEGSIE